MELITNRRLKKFLIEKGIYEVYIKNLIKSLDKEPDNHKLQKLYSINKENDSLTIATSFLWSKTSEGGLFWKKMSNQYKDRIEDDHIKSK